MTFESKLYFMFISDFGINLFSFFSIFSLLSSIKLFKYRMKLGSLIDKDKITDKKLSFSERKKKRLKNDLYILDKYFLIKPKISISYLDIFNLNLPLFSSFSFSFVILCL